MENPEKKSSDIMAKERYLSQNPSRLMPTGHKSISEISQKRSDNIQATDDVPIEQIERGRRRNRKPNVTIVSDSMLRKVNKQDINNEVPDLQCNIKSFPGARVEHMRSYVQPTIEIKPAGLIIMCGTNNLKSDTSEQIAERMIDLAVHASHHIENVAVSSIVMRTDSSHLDNKRKQVNALLETNLKHLGVAFIKHDNINESHLDRWGLHPNFSGRHILATNYINFLNSE
eukprot:Seg2230.3 transcript_id=Seg2230.3/GoldUCD/mRNA.D3Y31 product="hypothetical protein" protein_id=Seg2230.3/GoldUCD/D3Y31